MFFKSLKSLRGNVWPMFFVFVPLLLIWASKTSGDTSSTNISPASMFSPAVVNPAADEEASKINKVLRKELEKRAKMPLAVPTGSSFGDVEWVASITTTGKGKKAPNEIDTHTYAQGGNVKQVFEGVSNEDMFYFQDGYWLYKANEDNIYIVNDKKHNYMVIPMDGLLQMTGMLGQLVKIEISDLSINTEVLPEETLLGYPCNHLIITTDYTMKMKIAIIKKTMKFHEKREIWGATEIAGLNEINPGFLKKDFKTGIPDLDEMIQKEMEQQKKIGFPLKVITRSIQMDKKGKVKSEATTTMTVTKINTKNFPKSFFEIPGNYDHVTGPWEKKKLF